MSKEEADKELEKILDGWSEFHDDNRMNLERGDNSDLYLVPKLISKVGELRNKIQGDKKEAYVRLVKAFHFFGIGIQILEYLDMALEQPNNGLEYVERSKLAYRGRKEGIGYIVEQMMSILGVSDAKEWIFHTDISEKIGYLKKRTSEIIEEERSFWIPKKAKAALQERKSLLLCTTALLEKISPQLRGPFLYIVETVSLPTVDRYYGDLEEYYSVRHSDPPEVWHGVRTFIGRLEEALEKSEDKKGLLLQLVNKLGTRYEGIVKLVYNNKSSEKHYNALFSKLMADNPQN